MRHPKILTTIRNYSLPLFWADSLAGISVALIAFPLSIAIAIASGAEPIHGLITAVIGGFLISLVGGSRVQIGGPTGAFIVIVFGVIAEHGYNGLLVATFMAGIILIVAGYYRMGRFIAYVPEAVVNGFTIGIAILIAFSQLKDFLGLSFTKAPADFIETLIALWDARHTYQLETIGVSLLTLMLIVAFRRLAPRLPGLIVALAIASYGVIFFDLPVDTIFSRFGELPSTIPTPQLPSFSFDQIRELLPTAFVIAFLAGAESLLSAMVADRMSGGAHRPNAEVLAQGVANIASPLFGGMPVTGAIARTATNVRAGGKTPVAGLIHALTVFAMLMLASRWVGHMAMPALAALLILTAWNMSEPHNIRTHLKAPVSDRALMILTCVLTVFVDLTVAIGVGVSLGLMLRLRSRVISQKDWSKPQH